MAPFTNTLLKHDVTGISMQLSQLQIQHNTPQKFNTRLTKTWRAIQRQIKINTHLDQKMQLFFSSYRQALGADEQEFLNERYKMTSHFCNFIPRKTLTNTMIHQLMEYIDNEMDNIKQNPFCKSQMLDQLQQLKLDKIQERNNNYAENPQLMTSIRQHIENLPWIGSDLSDAQISEFIRYPEKGHDLIEEAYQEWLKQQPDRQAIEQSAALELEHLSSADNSACGYEDFLHDNFFDHDFFNDDFSIDPHQQQADHQNEYRNNHLSDKEHQLLKKLMKSKEVNRLYKKLVNQLHPDKFQKPSDQQHQSLAAIQELLTARKTQDFFQLLTLAQQYLPEYELILNQQQLKQLQLALDQKLATLKNEYQQAIEAPTPIARLWNEFYDSNQCTQADNFQKRKQQLNERLFSTKQIINKTNNIKHLKQYLSCYYNSLRIESLALFRADMMNELNS